MLFSWSGNPDTSIDVFEWDGPPGWLNQHIYKVTPAEGVDRDFLFFLLKWLKPRFAEIARNKQTTGLGHVTLADFKQMQIGLPKPDEQAAIVALVKPYHDKIELNRKMNATLEAMARALFRDWFVDFGPTRAKMAGRPPYLSPDLWPLFPARLDADGKPEGWEVRPLVDCFDLLMGQSPPGDTYNDNGEGLPFFQGRTDFGFRYPENRKYCSAPTRVAEKGDTLVSVRAPVGDINLAAERCCIGRGVAAIRHKAGKKSFTYYTAWSLQEELRQYESTGTVFGAINKKQFEKLPTIDPGPKVIEAFEEIASALDSRIDNNERESRTLAQTRDLLLPRLMSGEVRVAGAEAAL
jgi:type I restriction enzyme S subunit